jgi:membrane protease subunit (stomatin/prohibitin family)
VVVPYLGVFTYVIVENRGMAERSLKQQQAAQAQADEYIQAAAGRSDPAQQIANAKQLLDSGTITQSEFDGLKRAALAS